MADTPLDHSTSEKRPKGGASERFGAVFNDGVRRIDYILVWEEDLSDASDERPSESGPRLRNEKYREKFQANLVKAGVELEAETTVTSKRRIHFLKLFVTWPSMCFYAEYLRLLAPLKLLTKSTASGCLMRCNPMRQRVPNQPDMFYTCAFTSAKMHRFVGINQRDTFFTPTQRHKVAHEILGTRVYGEEKNCEIGIDQMTQVGIYSCAFPLHEGSHNLSNDADHDEQESDEGRNENDSSGNPEQPPAPLSPRAILRLYWASWCTWYKYQPLNHVRAYFGEKRAFYFAWLGLYTSWLLVATLVGTGVFAYGCTAITSDVPTNEVCRSGTAFKMCPICDEHDGCQFWHLSDICWKIRMANLLDHPATVVYSVFVSFWAVLFLEYWKRRRAALSHRWGVANFHAHAERPRPGYAIGCTEFRQDPITGSLEPHFPHWRRRPRIIASTACLVLMLLIVVAFILLIIVYQTVISIFLFRTPLFRSTAKLIGNVTGSILQLVVMLILERVFGRIAYRLTEWEMHKTRSEFLDQLTAKLFIFEVCNCYLPIVYIAFIKGRFSGYPGNYGTLFGFRPEDCDEGGCLFDLAVSLVVIMVGQQILRNLVAICLPKLLTRLHRSRKGLLSRDSVEAPLKPWEADYALLTCDGLSTEYREMVLQFGFITIFVAAFPLALLFALLNNWLRIRVDAKKLVCSTRIPLAERAQGIGIWFPLLEIIAELSVISNAFLIAFTSDFLQKILYMFEYRSDLQGFVNFTLAWSPVNSTSELCRYRGFRDPQGSYSAFYWKLLVVQLAFVIVFEHLVFSIRRLLMTLVPDIPRKLQLLVEREKYLGRQALVDTEAPGPSPNPSQQRQQKPGQPQQNVHV